MRKSRSTGVGTGNGPGSKATQYKDGQPSANPTGRPPKPKLPPTNDIAQAFVRELAKLITISDNGVSKKVTQAEAMAATAVARFPNAKLGEMLQLLRYLSNLKVEAPVEPIDHAAAERLVERLAEEWRRAEKVKREFPTFR